MREIVSTIYNFLFGPTESQDVKQLKKNCCHPNAKITLAKIFLFNKVLQQLILHNSVYHNNLAIGRLSYARSILWTLAEIDHRLSQLQNGLRKFESGIFTL